MGKPRFPLTLVEMRQNTYYETEGEAYPHAHAMSIASALLNHAKFGEKAGKLSSEVYPLRDEHQRGEQIPPDLSKIACLTYLAFALEGYLDLIGQYEFERTKTDFAKWPWWKRLAKSPLVFGLRQKTWGKLSAEERLLAVSEHYDLKLTKDADPFQKIALLFKFRNRQAHPKLLKVNKRAKGKDPHQIFDSLTIYRHLKPKDAESVYKVVRDLVDKIEAIRPDGEQGTWLKISQMSSTSEG